MRNFKDKKAQTAVELAVFGSILIFMLGLIIRSVHGRGLQQHSLLKATRYAMMMSHKTTESKRVSGRNSASVLIVEDRLTAASAKYGAIDRIPLLNQGSATHSANLFMPIDFGDSEDLPQFDLFVNGQHFAFTTGSFKDIPVAHSCSGVSPCPPECVDGILAGAPDCSPGSLYYYPAHADYNGDGITEDIEWEPNCVEGETITEVTEHCADIASSYPPWTCPHPSCTDCSNISEETYTIITTVVLHIGCAKFYTIIDNHPLIPQWCADGPAPFGRTCGAPDWPPPCSTAISPGCNLSSDERFDLDRDDLDGIPGNLSVPGSQRPGFAWQWFLVAGYNEGWRAEKYATSTTSLEADTTSSWTTIMETARLLLADSIVLPGGETPPKNTMIDVDIDLKLEYIIANVNEGAQPNQVGDFGIITRLGVMDPQGGDLDFTHNDSDRLRGDLPFGFTKDTNLFTIVNSGQSGDDGTYLQIDEGRLYSPSGQYIRTASKKDSIDLIERYFRLSNNTGAYCGTVDSPGLRSNPNGLDTNPVEVCGWVAGTCFTPGNRTRTCMDVPSNMIYIRSQIKDLHGRGWVTDESNDPYVNFVIN